MDEDIMNAVESLFGKDVKIVDCETTSSVQQEEVLLINGVPVKLDGIPSDDARAIKAALLDGQMPSVEHLNQLLFRAGLAQQPIEVETSLTVKSSLTTTEEVMVSRNGQILDERTVETKEHFNHQSHQKEIWQPLKQTSALSRATPENALKYCTDSNSTFATDTEERRQLNPTFSNVSLMSNTSSAIGGSASSTTIGDKSSNISSCDSGHDGLYHSVSMSAPWERDRTLTDSIYCDIPSSADEADAESILHIIEEPTTDAYAKDLPKAGTTEDLISLLVQCQNKDIEFSLLICSRLFLSPQELLSRLTKKCEAERLSQLTNHWLELCPQDFSNELLVQQLNEQTLAKVTQKLNQMEEKRQSQLQYLLTKPSSSHSLGRQSSIKSLKRFYKTDNLLSNCNNPYELAHQLYAIEYAYVSQLRLEEFVEMLSKGELKFNLEQTKASTLGANGRNQVNISAYVQWFNQLSQLTATEILKLGKKSQRGQMLDFWIETALECFNIGNFNSLMAILTALNTSALARLKKTWSKVQTLTKFSGLEHQMDPALDYVNYRSTMKAAIWRSERSKANKIERALIPYFRLFLKDCQAIYEGHQNSLASGLWNLEKCFILGSELRNFYKWQSLDCPYEQLPPVVAYLQKREVLTTDQLMKASYDCEPPETAEEKDHFKTLKAAKKS